MHDQKKVGMLILYQGYQNDERLNNGEKPDEYNDSNDNFKECKKRNVIPVIPVRKNFSGKAKGSTVRKKQGLIQLGNCEINKKNIKMFNDFPCIEANRILPFLVFINLF